MSRFRREHRAIVNVGSESRRLVSLIGMMIVLYVLISMARDPKMWRWFAGGRQQSASESSAETKPATLPLRRPKVEPTAPAQVAVEPGPNQPVPDPIGPTKHSGPTDNDPEELQAITEEIQAVSDGKPIDAVEMHAYWRIVRWVQNQSAEVLARRARRDLLYTHLLEDPEQFRGQIVHLDLDVRRIIAWDAPANSANVEKVYNAWGSTDESRGRRYCVVFVDRPPGLPIDPDVRERVQFDGYFYKLIPFEEPKYKNAIAPVLIGRLSWTPSEPSPSAANEWTWGLGLALIGLFVFSMRRLYWGKPVDPIRQAVVLRNAQETPAEEWLQKLDATESAAAGPQPPANASNPSGQTDERIGSDYLDGGIDLPPTSQR